MLEIHSIIENYEPEKIKEILDDIELKLSPEEFDNYLHRIDKIVKGTSGIKKIIDPVIFYKFCTVEKIKLLMEYGFDINIKDHHGRNALFRVGADKCKFLLESGIDISSNKKDKTSKEDVVFSKSSIKEIAYDKSYKNSPLFSANVEKIKVLLNYGYDINIKNEKGESILFNAPNIETLSFLIEKGFSPSTEENKRKQNVLFSSMIRPEVCEFLILNGANVNHKDERGSTPIFAGNVEKLKVFLKYNADTNIKNSEGINAAFNYASSNNQEVLTLLIEKNIDLNITDKNGKNILHYAGNPHTIKFLIRNGVVPLKDTDFLRHPSEKNNQKLAEEMYPKLVAEMEKEKIFDILNNDKETITKKIKRI